MDLLGKKEFVFDMSAVIVILILFAFLALLKVWFNYSRSDNGFASPGDDIPLTNTMGLDKESMSALPIFEYKSEQLKGGLECAVCLSQFEESEKLRVLPNCNHNFHVECINMWLHSHNSCPLCRTVVFPAAPPNAVLSLSTEGEMHTNNPLIEQPVSSNIAVSDQNVVHEHLMGGQRRSDIVQHGNPSSTVLRVHEVEFDQGIYGGIPLSHVSIDIHH
ncbi:hypothetical protein SUGI_0781490 [Cryptomeria japonica]|nr:hypothetical protein SUGI_0781490 [Cryptomeria japonica]